MNITIKTKLDISGEKLSNLCAIAFKSYKLDEIQSHSHAMKVEEYYVLITKTKTGFVLKVILK